MSEKAAYQLRALAVDSGLMVATLPSPSPKHLRFNVNVGHRRSHDDWLLVDLSNQGLTVEASLSGKPQRISFDEATKLIKKVAR